MAVLAVAALAGLVVLVAGQPIITSDLWWHLALGRAHAAQGPWLTEDPLLFTAPGPPLPSAWLWDLGLHGVAQLAGFPGLRLLHVALVTTALGLAFALLRRASGSLLLACAGTALAVALSAYRLAQLRPHLATLIGVLLLYRLLVEGGRPPSPRRIALAVAGMALWVNLHAGFLLGPVLLLGAAGGLVLAAPLRPRALRRPDLARAARLALAAALGGIATLANPAGLAPHRAWLAAGRETPSLLRVADEWLPVSLLRLPVPALPPSWLAWSTLAALVVLTPLAALHALRGWRRGDAAPVDPALVALGLGALPAPFLGVRFLWLAFLPLLLVTACAGRALAGAAPSRRRATAWALAAGLVLLVPGFQRFGDWPMVSNSLPRRAGQWAASYWPAAYHGHAVWLLADAGIEGDAYVDYTLGGFVGYWLAPALRTYLNGTLNVTPETMRANLAILERRGSRPDESFLELLDRLGIDVFLGIHPPAFPPGARPWYRTSGHLEGAPGWVLAFRNPRSALYLRASPHDAANLARLDAWYASQGVPFDPETGFDAARVIRESPGWAVRHGLVRPAHANLGPLSMLPGADGARALDELSATWAALGLHEHCVDAARRRLRRGESPVARRRLVWALLQLGRSDEALAEAAPLAEAAAADPLSRALVEAARRYPELDPEAAAALRAQLPVFTPAEAARLVSLMVQPPERPPRALSPPPGAPAPGA